MVPAPRYFSSRNIRTAPSAMRVRISSSTPGEGLSSINFWCRFWTEQSRSPSTSTVPWPSAMICNSTCRGFSRYRSINTVPSANLPGLPGWRWPDFRQFCSGSDDSHSLPPPCCCFDYDRKPKLFRCGDGCLGIRNGTLCARCNGQAIFLAVLRA